MNIGPISASDDIKVGGGNSAGFDAGKASWADKIVGRRRIIELE
jgi:hypothetical protein